MYYFLLLLASGIWKPIPNRTSRRHIDLYICKVASSLSLIQISVNHSFPSLSICPSSSISLAMALRNTATLIFFVMMVLSGVCLGDVYRVGDSDGWTSRGLVDYKKWASTKEFHVGDTLIFAYNGQFHNLMLVTKQDFESCNATAAIAVYTSGSDTITLKGPDHYYFLCGAPGHCQAGQKVDIKVTLPIPQSSLASPNPAPQGSLPSDSHPSSTPSSAPTIYFSKLGLAVSTLVLCLLSAVF